MSDKPPKKKETDFLNLPPGSDMADRVDPPQTKEFTKDSLLELRIDEQRLAVTVDQEVIVGRSVEGDAQNQVEIDLSPQGAYQSGVSRRHAIIRRHNDSLYVEDLRSTNGTRINGSQLTPEREYRLRDGDEVEFARVRAIVRFVREQR